MCRWNKRKFRKIENEMRKEKQIYKGRILKKR